MKEKILFTFKSLLFTLIAFMLSTQTALAQDALTSVNTNIQNVMMSSDQKTISYDVYYQDVDPTYPVEIPGYLFRLAVPQADLGTNAKTVTVTNANAALGVTAVSMTLSGTDWVMKFMNGNFISTYAGALLASETFPGTLVGTFNIQNTDGTVFANPQIVHVNYSGTSPILKSTVSIFLKDQVVLTPNTSTAQPITNFAGLGLYTLTLPVTSVTPVTITDVTANNKVYDGTSTTILTGGTLNGVVSGDVVTLIAGSGTFDDKNAGSGKTVTVMGYSLGGADAAKYGLSAQPTGLTASITTAPTTITGVTASDKVYDGSTAATITGGALNGIVSGDIVTLVAGTGTFADNSIGTNKTVTATGYSISGTDASNYLLSAQPGGLTASITAPVVSVLDALTSVKTNIQNVTMSSDQKTISYDVYYQDVDPTNPVEIPGYLFRLAVPQADLGTNTKTVTVTNANAALGATAVAMTGSGSNWVMKFTNANFISTYAGALLASETFPGTLVGTFNIQNTDGTAFANPQNFNATYSGSSTILKSTVSVFLKDQVAVAPNTSTAQPITNFTGLGLYTLTVPVTPLTITDVTANNKVYDGTATAILSGGTLSGVTQGDIVTLIAGTGTFDNKNAGSGKTVSATGYSLGGADAAKYGLSAQPTGLTASITTAPTTITGVTANSKVYDGNTAATLTGGALTGIVPGDVVTLITGTGTFSDKDNGLNKIVTATGYSISGTDATNYELSAQPGGLTASITTPVVLGPDALTSLKINIQNVRMSSDQKTISYDVYYQDVDPTYPVEIPGYIFRLAVPLADLGTNAKTVTVTNANEALGVTAAAMTVSGSNWLMKFLNGNFISTYAGALLASETFPGTLVGTFNIQNTDETSFADPQIFNATYSGSSTVLKSTVTVFLINQVAVAPNTSTAQPITNFTGLGLYTLTSLTTEVPVTSVNDNNFMYPNPANNSFVVNLGSKVDMVNVFDLNGKKLISQLVTGRADINISSLIKGVYIVSVNGIHKKLIKN